MCDNCKVERAKKRIGLVTGATRNLCNSCYDVQQGVSSSTPSPAATPTGTLSRPVAEAKKATVFKMPSEPFSMNVLTRILAEQAFSDEMIWTGHASLFPILHQFKTDLNKYAKVNNPLGTIWFYFSEDVVGKSKAPPVHAFRISPAERVADVIVEVLSRLTASHMNVLLPAKKCRLETEAGYKLRPSARLSEFGFGSLLTSWRLELKAEPKKCVTALYCCVMSRVRTELLSRRQSCCRQRRQMHWCAKSMLLYGRSSGSMLLRMRA
jgi:hypothetical protein